MLSPPHETPTETIDCLTLTHVQSKHNPAINRVRPITLGLYLWKTSENRDESKRIQRLSGPFFIISDTKGKAKIPVWVSNYRHAIADI